MPRRPALQPVQLQTVKPSLTSTQMFADVCRCVTPGFQPVDGPERRSRFSVVFSVDVHISVFPSTESSATEHLKTRGYVPLSTSDSVEPGWTRLFSRRAKLEK